MATQDNFIRTALRVPPDLHRAIHEAAQKADRTFNAEIINRLQSTFGQPKIPGPVGLSVDLVNQLDPGAQRVIYGLHGQLLETMAKLMLDELAKERAKKLNPSDSSPPAPQSPPP